MSISVIVTLAVVFGGMFLILFFCFVYALIKRNAIVKLDQEKTKEVNKIIKESKDIS